MQGLVLYQLLQASVLLLVGTLLYYVLFWRSTFLRWNRVLLWGILLASLILPFVHLPAAWTVQLWQKKEMVAAPEPHLKGDEGLFEPQFFMIAHHYQENTTKLIKEEFAGLRLEIFTEE